MSKKIEPYRVVREKGCGRGMRDIQIGRNEPSGGYTIMTGRIGESAATSAEHVEMVRDLNAFPDMLAALREAVDAFGHAFNDDSEINGGDLLEWFSGWRETAKAAIAKAQAPK